VSTNCHHCLRATDICSYNYWLYKSLWHALIQSVINNWNLTHTLLVNTSIHHAAFSSVCITAHKLCLQMNAAVNLASYTTLTLRLTTVPQWCWWNISQKYLHTNVQPCLHYIHTLFPITHVQYAYIILPYTNCTLTYDENKLWVNLQPKFTSQHCVKVSLILENAN